MQNNSHLSGRAGLKSNQCHKGHRKRKILLNHDGHHYVIERFKKLICEVQGGGYPPKKLSSMYR